MEGETADPQPARGRGSAGRPGPPVLGRAVTHGQTLPLGSDDPVVAARAVRRALADAGRRATDVTDLVLAMTEAVAADIAAAFARRALGPHGERVRTRCLAVAAGHSEDHARQAADHLGGTLSGSAVGLAVGLDDCGDVVALCLGPESFADTG